MRRPAGIRGVILGMMPTTAPTPQIVVRVVPRLLADALSIVLAGRSLEVCSFPPGERRSTPRAPRTFDLAIVTESLPPDVRANRVILVDDGGTPTAVVGGGAVPASRGSGDLSLLLGLIDDLLR